MGQKNQFDQLRRLDRQRTQATRSDGFLEAIQTKVRL